MKSPLHIVTLLVLANFTAVGAASPIDFNASIRPLLNEHCAACHGGVKQAGDFSFVYPETVLPPRGWIIEPGDAERSELITRIRSTDPEHRMPPPGDHSQPLSEQEIALFEQWIREGAEWGEHWSLVPLSQPTVPEIKNPQWVKNSIDSFVVAHLEGEDLQPTAGASPSEWLRRVSLDLIGLPPSFERLEIFKHACQQAADSQALESVYADQVDSLLASQHFGERWATLWMDLARYADSQGFEKDPHRNIWPYRDWLIEAFNQDMPYDEFTIKQLAGDLLPEPTVDDLLATAFHRHTQTNTEGGTDDEEFRVAAVIDRVNTTWTVWQATTLGCVQCHAHPYDAYQHEDFYAALALFNSSEDVDLNSDFPTLKLSPDKKVWGKLAEQQRDLLHLERQRNQLGVELAATTQWQALGPLDARSSHGQIAVEGNELRTVGGTFPVGTEFMVEALTPAMTALKLTILPSTEDPKLLPEQGAMLTFVELTLVAEDGTERQLKIEDAFADYLVGPYGPRDCLQNDSKGFGGYPKLRSSRWVCLVLGEPLVQEPCAKLRIRLVQKGNVTGNLATHIKRLRLELTADPQWTGLMGSPELTATDKRIADIRIEREAIKGFEFPIMTQCAIPATRPTRMFVRGNWLELDEEVGAGLPGIFQEPGGASVVTDRLQLAQWLVGDSNPLAARVWANRIWATFFGIGLVETLEDFGSSGGSPSHPALLDFLAWRLRQEHQWHLKPLLREIVLSATYRQTHSAAAELLARDADNRLLARGPRLRLSAEMIRDSALAISGLLSPQIGGPSVMPPQPDGVWQTVYSGEEWKSAAGADRYRRGLYTYWKRTSPYPGFLAFDAPTRDICSPRRIDTNTPLQALVTLNDPVYQECAEALAQTAAAETMSIRSAIALMLARAGADQTAHRHSIQSELMGLYQDVLRQLTAEQALTKESTEEQASPVQASPAEPIAHAPGGLSVAQPELQALTVVASTIFNLDMVLTK